jgi:chromosome segregation ATPase
MKYPFRKYMQAVVLLTCGLIVLPCEIIQAQSSGLVDDAIGQVRQIDSRLRDLQSELTTVESQSAQTGRDSAAIVSASSAQLKLIQSKIAQVDNAISAKKNEIAEVKAQRMDLSRDSLAKVTALNSQKNDLKEKIRQLEQAISVADNELKVLNQRKAQMAMYAQQASDPSLGVIQKEKNRYDSMAVSKQEILNGLHVQLKQLENDSAVQAGSLSAIRARNAQALQQNNNDIAAADARVASAKNALDQSKIRLGEKKGAIGGTVQQLMSRKATLASSVTQSQSRINGYENELSKLRASAGALQQKYEAGRAPLVTQLNEATTTLATREQQKQIWTQINEKHVIDSMISNARNELDQTIQDAATGKRGAKKLIDTKENELNALLGQQDTYLKIPGLKQMEAQLTSLTPSQKRARIEQVLGNITADLSKQQTAKMRAEQALAAYDANNPISSDPSLRRMRSLDTLLATEQQKKAALSSGIDSADYLVKVYKDSITALDAASYNEISAYDSEYRNAVTQKNTLIAQRDQQARTQNDEYSASSSSIASIIDRMNGVRQKIWSVEQEIQNAQSRSADAQQRLAASQQKFEQGRMVASNEAAVMGKTISEKELAIKELRDNAQLLRSQQGGLESNNQNEITTVANAIAAKNQQINSKNAELQQLNNQRNSLKFEYDNEVSKQQSSIESLRSASSGNTSRRNSLKAEIASLQSRRAAQLAQIQNQVTVLSSSINRANLDVENANSAYKTALQDSVNFESTRDDAFFTVKRSITRQDSVINALRVEMAAVSAAYEKGRADSAAAVSMKEASIAPNVKKIRQLDSLIILKEKELNALKSKRLQAVQDSITQAQGADDAIQRSTGELRKKQERMNTLEIQYAMQEKEKKRIESDAAQKGEQFKNSRQLYSTKINSQMSRLAEYQGKLAKLTTDLQNAEAALAAAEGRTMVPTAGNNVVEKKTIKNSKDAQLMIEKIYTLMGDNRMDEAKKLFDSNITSLKKYASPDAVKMLESSF